MVPLEKSEQPTASLILFIKPSIYKHSFTVHTRLLMKKSQLQAVAAFRAHTNKTEHKWLEAQT